MIHLPELGVSAPELGWVPSPTFALRRRAILDRISTWPPGRVLEVGCGAGAVLFDLALRGYTGIGVELSTEARRVATAITHDLGGVEVVDALPTDAEAFDYLFSFEVLEHIEDDHAALEEWVARLKRGGRALISVPAHPERWNLTDTMAGHYRRYDRDAFTRLLVDAGLQIEWVETYGFPATWVIERARLAAKVLQVRRRGLDPSAVSRGDAELTQASGVDRTIEARLFPVYGSWLGRKAMSLAADVQRRFRDTDWGISYLALAHR